MTIGIAIPTYSGHLYNLKNLLYQISKSTVLPSQVSVSISSFDEILELGEYPFELIITKCGEFKNVSQNCNTAASKLTTDIISFFGGDDLPHIKRNEYLLKAFESGAKAVVHGYKNSHRDSNEFVDDIGDIDLIVDYIDQYLSDNHFPLSSKEPLISYANGAISITREIFNKYKYNEDQSFFKMEDTIYNSNLVKNGYNISYIRNNLMLYIH